MNWFLLNLSPFCSGISVSAMREDRGWFLSRACEKKNPSLIFNDDRKIPTRWSNVPVGNKACRVSHWSGGPEGWHFGTSWRQRHVSAVLYIATLISHGQRLFHMGTDIGSILPLTRKHRDLSPANMYIWDPYGQNLGIYPIRVLHGPHIGFFAHIRPI